MANKLRKLKRWQLLELMVAQGKELEAQRKAAQEAQARVAELEEKLAKVAEAALESAEIVAQAKREAEAILTKAQDPAAADGETRRGDDGREPSGRTYP